MQFLFIQFSPASSRFILVASKCFSRHYYTHTYKHTLFDTETTLIHAQWYTDTQVKSVISRIFKWVPGVQIKWVRWRGHVGHTEKNSYGEET
jgi:hypothetical protein